MKCFICAGLSAFIILSASACGTSKTSKTENSKAKQEQQILDLTAFNDTVAYSQMVQLVNDSDSYKGTVIRVDGIFRYLKEGKTEYFSVLVQDETNCCMEGMDFELKEPKKYPNDFPSLEDDIVVQGVFDDYIGADGNKYCCLRNAEMAVK